MTVHEKCPQSPARETAVSLFPRPQVLYVSQSLQQHSISIPQIIHQSWRTRKLKAFQTEWQKTWLHNHPGWTYMFWTDKDNRRLIADHFPWFLDVYDSFPRNIQRADCARYFYMLHFGGCYFDLDFESLKNLGPLLLDVQVALAYMTQDTESELSIPNAFVASVPGHAFWWYVIKHVLMAVASEGIGSHDAHRITGPIMLKKAVAQYQTLSPMQDLTIFPSDTIYGVDYSWRYDPAMLSKFLSCHAASQEFNSTECKLSFPGSYSITYWSGDLTWNGWVGER
ncbi:hypothetical protein ABBQ32_008769 [Trebouxia sp. C0010 RCD-2024]